MLREADILVMLVCALSVASVAWTIAKASVFEPFRQSLLNRWFWGYDLVSCPYCLSHYLSGIIAFLVGYRPVSSGMWFLDWMIATFATITLATGFGGYLIRYAMKYSMKENERIEALEEALLRAKQAIKQLQNNEND